MLTKIQALLEKVIIYINCVIQPYLIVFLLI